MTDKPQDFTRLTQEDDAGYRFNLHHKSSICGGYRLDLKMPFEEHGISVYTFVMPDQKR